MRDFIKKIIEHYKKKENFRKLRIIILLLLTLFIYVSYITHNEGAYNTQETVKVSYVEFQKMLNSNNVKNASINPSEQNFYFEDMNGKIYATANPKVDGFKESLLLKGVDVSERKELNIMSVISTALMAIFILVILRSIKGGGSAHFTVLENLGNNKKFSFNNVAGNQESSEEMKQLIDFLKNPRKYEMVNAKMPKGVILQGPPGTGKTLMAKSIAGEAGVPFITANGSDFVNMFVGKGADNVRALYKLARKKAPCIVFIDEIDSIAGNRNNNQSHVEHNQTINQLLGELDGVNSKKGILTIVATNRADKLDPAFVRPGRFDKVLTIGLPTFDDRKSIFNLYLENQKCSNDFNLDIWVRNTVGTSGAFIENLVNEAILEGIKRMGDVKSKEEFYLCNQDFEEAFFRIVMQGSKRKLNDRIQEESKIVAWHEAGHALATKLVTKDDVLNVTTIPSTSGAEGVAIMQPNESKFESMEEFEGYVMSLMAGRASEELLLKDYKKITSGASNDIKKATDALLTMITELGMDEENRFVNLNIAGFDKSEINKKLIAKSNELYQKTLELLTENRDKLEKIATILEEKETISGEEIEKIINA